MLLDEAEGVADAGGIEKLRRIVHMAGWVALHVVSPPSHDGDDVARTVDVIALQVVDVGKFNTREIFVEASLCGREGTVLPRPSSNRAHSLLESAARSGVGRRHGVSMVDRTSSKHDTATQRDLLCLRVFGAQKCEGKAGPAHIVAFVPSLPTR